MGNHFRIQEIRFDSLIVVSRVEKQTREDSLAKIKSTSDSFNFYDLIKGQMKSLKVGKIAINNGKATWINPETKGIWRKIEEVQFDIRQIELDSITAATNNGWFTLTTATLEGKNGELFLADSLHKIHLKKFQIDYCKKTMTVDSLEVIPIMTKSQMTATKRYETNRLTVVAPRITVTGVAIGVDAVLTYGLKYTVNRPRPATTYWQVNGYGTETSGSFPSGHTSVAFATATALSLKYTKWYVVVPAFAWAGSVGYSRMNLGMHYPSDVVAGALLGAGSAYATYFANQWFWKKQQNSRLIGLQPYL
jgi:hypothetical protein